MNIWNKARAWYNGWAVTKGFPGHKGRPGQRGGSLPRVGRAVWQGLKVNAINEVADEIGPPSKGHKRLGHAVKDIPSAASIGPPLVEGEIREGDKGKFDAYREGREEYGLDMTAGWAAEELIWGYGHWGMIYDVPEGAAFKGAEPGEFVFDIGNEELEIPALLLNVTRAHARGLSDVGIKAELEEAESRGFDVFVVQEDSDSSPLP